MEIWLKLSSILKIFKSYSCNWKNLWFSSANGFVIDGSGQNRTKSDIGITGEKISFIGDSKGKESKESINVDGMIVSPGFIDTHTHHDGVLLLYYLHIGTFLQFGQN